MLRPEEQLEKFSFDDEVYHVLRTPNRLKSQKEQFEGWENLGSPPVESSQRKYKHDHRNKFVIKSHKQRLDNTQHSSRNILQTVQNKQNHPTSYRDYQLNMKMLQLIDQQLLSPKSRKIITPNRLSKAHKNDMQYHDTPKTVRRESSLRKLYATQRLNKLCYSQKRHKDNVEEDTFCGNANPNANVNEQINDTKETFKIPLSAILYPVLKMNSKRPHRRIERFHSFVARTVRK